jgi:protease I
MERLDGLQIAFLATDGVEQIELTRPWDAISAAGGTSLLIAPEGETIQGFDHDDKGDTFEVDATAVEVDVTQFDALVLPGGVANPDRLRTDNPSVEFVRTFIEAGKPIAVICHGAWTLIEADAVRGRRLTSWPSIRTDLVNAGAEWVDEEVVVCEAGPSVLVSSRKPDDLDAFCEALVDRFATVRTA